MCKCHLARSLSDSRRSVKLNLGRCVLRIESTLLGTQNAGLIQKLVRHHGIATKDQLSWRVTSPVEVPVLGTDQLTDQFLQVSCCGNDTVSTP
eukprot:817116-Amphidinium_carterae.1